jgi:hypothetical protein
MSLVSFGWQYCVLVVQGWFGIGLLIFGVLQLGEWLIDKKVPVPIWLRLVAFGTLLFIAQASIYKKLSENPPTILHIPPPPAPTIQVIEPPKIPAKTKPEQNQSGHDNVQSGSITQGPCSNIQLGGSNNSQGGNCATLPLTLTPSLVIVPSDQNGFIKTIITVVPNIDVVAPVNVALKFSSPVKSVGFWVQGAGVILAGGPDSVSDGLRPVIPIGTGFNPKHALLLTVYSVLPVKLEDIHLQ